MFSIRTGIWVVLVIFLLPSNESGKQELYKQASNATNYAYSTAGYLSGMCSKIALCAYFDPSWDTFTKKAQTGVDLIADFISSRDGLTEPQRRSGSSLLPADLFLKRGRNNSKNTLEISDLIPVWQGPECKSYASR